MPLRTGLLPSLLLVPLWLRVSLGLDGVDAALVNDDVIDVELLARDVMNDLSAVFPEPREALATASYHPGGSESRFSNQ